MFSCERRRWARTRKETDEKKTSWVFCHPARLLIFIMVFFLETDGVSAIIRRGLIMSHQSCFKMKREKLFLHTGRGSLRLLFCDPFFKNMQKCSCTCTMYIKRQVKLSTGTATYWAVVLWGISRTVECKSIIHKLHPPPSPFCVHPVLAAWQRSGTNVCRSPII